MNAAECALLCTDKKGLTQKQCFTRLRPLDTLPPQAGAQCSPNEAQRNPGTFALAAIPFPDCHPGYKNGALVR